MTNAEVTVGDGPLRALPVATDCWSAYAMDPAYWSTVGPHLRAGAVVVVNSSLFDSEVGVADAAVFGVPASDVADELGSPWRPASCCSAPTPPSPAWSPSTAWWPPCASSSPLPHPAPGGQRAGHRRRGGRGHAPRRAGLAGRGRLGGGGGVTRRLLQGSEAVADAAIVSGCRFFSGYPMLPFTELLENMAKKLPAAGGVSINAESEIEAVNMALGAAATGARRPPARAARGSP